MCVFYVLYCRLWSVFVSSSVAIYKKYIFIIVLMGMLRIVILS